MNSLGIALYGESFIICNSDLYSASIYSTAYQRLSDKNIVIIAECFKFLRLHTNYYCSISVSKVMCANFPLRNTENSNGL